MIVRAVTIHRLMSYVGIDTLPPVNRLLACLAVGADPLFDWGDFPSSFRFGADRCDCLMISLNHLADLAVASLGLELQDLRNQVAFLLCGQMAAMDVESQDGAVNVAIIMQV